jgi:histidinol phosphatase-like enzyme
MALEAQQIYTSIDFSKSIMVGDTNTDIQFGQRLGMYTICIESQEIVKETPDFSLSKLADLSLYL